MELHILLLSVTGQPIYYLWWLIITHSEASRGVAQLSL